MQGDTRGPVGRTTRRIFLGMAAAAALPLRNGTSAQRVGAEAEALVGRFYELIDAYRYEQAYTLLGARRKARRSLDRFTSGYRNTAFVQCRTTIETISDNAASIGADLVSWHNDGSIVAYKGTYIVSQEQGQLAIVSADVMETSVPEGTPRLCGVSEVDLAFGPWHGAAGSREGSILATNTSGAACALGGSPRLSLTDAAGNVLVSTSEAGSSPEAVVLGPGESARATVRFSNWCGVTDGTAAVRAALPGGADTAPVSAAGEGVSWPPCNGPGQPPSLQVRGWTR